MTVKMRCNVIVVIVKSRHFFDFSMISDNPMLFTRKPNIEMKKMNHPGPVFKSMRAGLNISARESGSVEKIDANS